MTAEELNYLSTVCFRDAQDVEGHLYYKGQERKAYAQTSFTLRGTKYHMRKAQLSLFLKLKEEGFQMENWGEKLTTSHLCHKKEVLQHVNKFTQCIFWSFKGLHSNLNESMYFGGQFIHAAVKSYVHRLYFVE